MLELARGRAADALAAFQAAERLGRLLAAPDALIPPARARLLQALVRLGDLVRYLPANLSAREIASELYVSPNTVKTHVHHLYTNSARTGAARPSRAPAPSACSHPRHTGADPAVLAPQPSLSGTSA